MAVIGARPASGPWILGRRMRAGSRTRPRPVRRGRHLSADRRRLSRVDVRPVLVAIAVAVALGLFYLSQSAHVAATGYQIDALQGRLAEVRAEQQQLILAIGQARSPAEISRRARSELGLVPLERDAVTYARPEARTDD